MFNKNKDIDYYNNLIHITNICLMYGYCATRVDLNTLTNPIGNWIVPQMDHGTD